MNTATQTQIDTPTFSELPLSEPMLSAVHAAGYHTPTPIQAQAIEPALSGQDVIGAAQTGTGKTAAFLIPIIEQLRAAPGIGLVLAPTRELAEQIKEWAGRLGGDVRAAVVVGGSAYGPQERALRRRSGIIVATPGRFVDHLERGTVQTKHILSLIHI